MKRKLLALAAGALLITSAGAAQAQEGSWIHIRVDEIDGAKVNVNLPMSLVEVALEVVQNEAFGDHGVRVYSDHDDEGEEHGEYRHRRRGIRIGHRHDMDLEDLRRLWSELRAAGDAEYVDVQDGDEHVRIYRRGDRVHVEVDDGDDENVRVEVPFSVVDVLLEGDGDELNLVGAFREMARANNGEIVQINDGDTSVRIWIDTNPQG